MGYPFQASGIWKGSDLTSWSTTKGVENLSFWSVKRPKTANSEVKRHFTAVKKSKKRFGCHLFIVKKRQKVLFKAVKRDAELSAEVNIYTLIDGLAYNTCGYFASCVIFSEPRRGEEKYEQWAKCPHVLYAKPSNKVYILTSAIIKPSNKRFIIPLQKKIIWQLASIFW